MRCKIFKGDIPTIQRDINGFLEELSKEPLFKIISVTQSGEGSNLIVTIIYS